MSATGITGIDADTLALLTDEERSAIEDPEYSAEELEAMKGIAGEESDDEDDDEDDEGSEGEVDPDGKECEGAPGPKTEDKGTDTDPEPAPAKTEHNDLAPSYQAELPADYQGRVDAMKADKAALQQKFRDGDIEFDDYNAELDKLNEQADELKAIKLKATISSEMNQQSAQQEWDRTINSFTGDVAKEVDYLKDPVKQQDLDAFVKALAANPANGEKSMRWFLDEAHKRVLALHDIKPAATPKNDGAKPDPKKDRKAPVDAAPKTLAQVPGSDGPGDVAGEFADLDSLEGMELEQAIARMTPAQRERYAQS